MFFAKEGITDPVSIRFLEADAYLRNIDGRGGKEFTVEAIACFFYVASHEGCNKQSMEKELGLSSASGSRNTDLLSKNHRLKLPNGEARPGLGLISKKIDPENRKNPKTPKPQ